VILWLAMGTDDSLPDDVTTLKAMLRAARAARLAAEAEAQARILLIEKLKLTIKKLRHEQFGQSSERGALLDQLELQLADLEENAAQAETAAQIAADDKVTVAPFERRKPARRPLPEHLPRERIVYPVPATYPCCGDNRLRKIGEDVAAEAVKRIDVLFAVEREINGLAPQERLRVRQERSRPSIVELKHGCASSVPSSPGTTTRPRQSITASAAGMPSPASSMTAACACRTTPPNASYGPSLSEDETGPSPDPMRAVGEPQLSTPSSPPPSSTTSIHRSGSPTCWRASTIMYPEGWLSFCPGTGESQCRAISKRREPRGHMRASGLSAADKSAVTAACQQLIDDFLRPRFLPLSGRRSSTTTSISWENGTAPNIASFNATAPASRRISAKSSTPLRSPRLDQP